MSDLQISTRIEQFLQTHQENYIADLSELVNRDCGTEDKAGVDAVARWFERRCADWSWRVETLPQPVFGDNVVARLRGTGSKRLMLIGHLDTVYPAGTAAQRPMKRVNANDERGEILLGPGTCDIKGGLLVGLYAVRALQHIDWQDFEEITFFFNSEEEVGSPESQKVYAPIAKTMHAVLVLEAARANGDIVGARKGVANYRVRVFGKSAHAGVEPEKGSNAILELAHRIQKIHALNGIAPGVTANAGVIGGGTRPNVVPDMAWVDVDVRAIDTAGALAMRDAMQKLAAEPVSVRGTRVEIRGDFGFMPMAKTAPIQHLIQLAQESAREFGFEVNAASTGGVSDANKMAELGVPVLDGLGPVGGLDHGPDEYIEVRSIVPRAALLARLMMKI